MILRAAKAVAIATLAMHIPTPAYADVLEIGTSGEARWVGNGPGI